MSSLLLLALALPAFVAADEVPWLDAPRMHDPTRGSVTLAAVPAVDCEIAVEVEGRLLGRPVRTRAGALFEQVVSGLPPGSTTAATVRVRALPDGAWTELAPRLLGTLPGPRDPLRFALLADTHAWALYSMSLDSPLSTQPYKTMKAALDNVAGDGTLDFAVALTDVAMTHCGVGCFGVSTAFGDTTEGHVDDVHDAFARYRAAWSHAALGRVAEVLPTYAAFGDHEGEMPFLAPEIRAWSRAARTATLPELPPGVLRGPAGTRAWAVEAGPALLVFLDVHAHTLDVPHAPDDWHLGAAQHAWLAQALGTSAARWKIVLAEHLVGGLSEPGADFWKGRGGITATDTGDPSGDFLGEQQLVHTTLRALGGDLFVTAHDHVAAWGVKDGVAYLVAGRAGGVTHPWADEDWYRAAMDYDGDGVPEFETDVTGTRKPGHVVVEADETTLHVTYVRASTDPSTNGQTILAFTLEDDGR